jgi:hypothetical protein
MTELSVNAAELSMNAALNAAEFQFFKRLLLLSHVKRDSAEF